MKYLLIAYLSLLYLYFVYIEFLYSSDSIFWGTWFQWFYRAQVLEKGLLWSLPNCTTAKIINYLNKQKYKQTNVSSLSRDVKLRYPVPVYNKQGKTQEQEKLELLQKAIKYPWNTQVSKGTLLRQSGVSTLDVDHAYNVSLQYINKHVRVDMSVACLNRQKRSSVMKNQIDWWTDGGQISNPLSPPAYTGNTKSWKQFVANTSHIRWYQPYGTSMDTI